MRINYIRSDYTFRVLTGLLIFLSLAFRLYYNSPVKGSVSPANGASRAWLISKQDTLNAPVIEGNFMITNAKPGNYTLMLEARPPYRDSFKQDVLVVEGQPTDVGVIEMNK
ncbi:MAG TPA: hypothetical protein VFI33_03710 [Puia sp.]|nr:hypothetical protein [Puia sp.]